MYLSIIGVGFYFIYTIIEPHRIYSYAKLLLHQFSSFLELILQIEHTMGPRKTNKNKTMNGNLWFHWLTNLYGNQCLKCFNGKKSNHTKTTTVLGKVQATYVCIKAFSKSANLSPKLRRAICKVCTDFWNLFINIY